MAGDWIPYCKDLPEKPEVLSIAEATGRTIDEVVMALLRLWSWADAQSEDGSMRHAPVTQLSRICPTLDALFVDALVRVQWIRYSGKSIEFINFDRWMGNSAKKRLLATRRKQRSRQTPTFSSRSGHTPVTPLSRNKRDENGTTGQDSTVLNPPTPLGGETGAQIPGESAASSPEPAAPSTSFAAEVAARNTISDHPELAAVAKRVVAHYQATVKPTHNIKNGQTVVLQLLLAGVSEQLLRNAAAGYAAFCTGDGNRDRPYRDAVYTFYSANGSHPEYLDWQPPAPAKPFQPEPRKTPPSKTIKELQAEREAQGRASAHSSPANAPKTPSAAPSPPKTPQTLPSAS